MMIFIITLAKLNLPKPNIYAKPTHAAKRAVQGAYHQKGIQEF